MRGRWLVVTVICALLAFCGAFAGVAVGLDLTQPALAGADTSIPFQVNPGDGASAVAGHLKQQGLIRDATLFRVLATMQHLDAHLRAGIYQLSADMSMSAILKRLLTGRPDQLLVIVPPGKTLVVIPPGLRATEYPPLLAALPNFNAASFLKIAANGVLPSGKHLSDLYWYVQPKGQGVYYALEGYLFPDTYLFNTTDDESAVVQRMLDDLGEHLCPGPDAAHANQYIHDQAQCKAHAAAVGPKNDSIFAEMEQRYFTGGDRLALYDTLMIASLVVRVTPQDASAPGVASVYYNRYLASRKNGYSPAGDYVPNLDSSASVQYAQDSDHPPKNGNWWAPLLDDPANVDSGSAYNTASPDNTGLIPGPIAAPTWADVVGAATADQPSASPYYFVAADRCGTAHFARTLADFLYVSQNAAAGCYNN
jgi:UPF0755 protein